MGAAAVRSFELDLDAFEGPFDLLCTLVLKEQRALSQAALETLAIVAYLGPVSRPEIARIRGVAADSAVAGLVERGLIAEAGREKEGGAIRYESTPLFE